MSTIEDSSLSCTIVFHDIKANHRGGVGVIMSKEIRHHDISWHFILFIREDTTDKCLIYVHPSIDVVATFSIKLINHRDDNKTVKCGPDTHNFMTCEQGCLRVLTRSNLVLDPLYGFLVNDAIKITFNLRINGKIKISNLYKSLTNDMNTMLFDKDTCDYIIQIPNLSNRKRKLESSPSDYEVDEIIEDNGSKTIPVHKFILQLRSPVFKTMLSSRMKESTSNEIIISDFDHDAVKEFIRFLYLDKCDKDILDKHAKSLLAMAHKYEVKGLLNITVDYLTKTLSDDTVVELLQLADLYEAENLKMKALKFIKTNLKDLTKAGRFSPLSQELLLNLINHLADD